MKKKICIDCRMIEHSGLGTYLKNLIPRLILKGQDVKFILLGDELKLNKYVTVVTNNIEIIHMEAPIFSIKEQIELFKKIPKDVDLMWTPHFNISVFYSRRLLVTIHDVFHLSMPNLAGGYHKYLYAKLLFLLVKIKSHKILCVSEFTKNEIKKFLGVSEEKIFPIYLGVEEFWYNIPKNIESPHCKPYILFVGNVKSHKNLLTLMQAFNAIKNDVQYANIKVYHLATALEIKACSAGYKILFSLITQLKENRSQQLLREFGYKFCQI